ncbi:putative histone-lysine N-methyltransferase [Abeliophyllum distichum]|uniref:Histone-lysine N-methyltransferase n=1 Tax=Abeliophyllum distichum TaxID=126358 RepID=A0ABD1TY53_9LAMI
MSNSGLSCENPNKLPLVIGSVPKYKPRKVSAVRDFPPGCGPNATPVDLKFDKNGHGGAIVVETGGVITSKVANGVENSATADMESNGVENSEMANSVEANAVKDAEISEVMIKNSVTMSCGGTIGVKCPEIEVVNNPIEIEIMKSLEGTVGEVVTTAMDGFSNSVEELMMDTRTVGAELQNDFKNISKKEVIETEGQTMEGLNGAEYLALVKYTGSEEVKPVTVIGGSQLLSSPKGSMHGSVKLGTSFWRKDKYRRRRVSAVRDFPPFCGPNAPQPTQEERQVISCGKDCVDGIKKFEVETDATQNLRKNLERGALMETPVVSQTESLDGVEKVEVKTEAIGTSGENVRKHPLLWRHRFKAVAKRSKIKREISGGPSIKKKSIPIPSGNSGALILRDEKRYGAHDENLPSNSRASYTPHDFDVNIPPKRSSQTDARNRVIETLRMFRSICRKCSQDEAKSENQPKRIDLLAVEIIKNRKMEVNTGKKILGEVPGVEVGDEFQYRAELAIVGIHRPYQAGIDSMKHKGISVANSIVDAGVYAGDKHNADVIIYSGQGGNIVEKNKPPEDQKLKKGNLALKNSISAKTPVRVIRGRKETKPSSKLVTTYVYDGLYTVDRYWQETGPHGKLVYMFELRRIPGQPKLSKKLNI